MIDLDEIELAKGQRYSGGPGPARAWSDLEPIRFRQRFNGKVVVLDPVRAKNPRLREFIEGLRRATRFVRLLKAGESC